MCIKSQPQAAPAHSRPHLRMARTYPYSLPYRTCLGRLEDPYSFSSIYLEDLYSGQKTYKKAHSADSRYMKAVFIGSMIPIPISLVVWNPRKQCPGIIQCKTVTRFQVILLIPFPVPPGIIPATPLLVLLLPVILCIHILAQCPRLTKRIIVQTRCPLVLRALLLPLRNRDPEKEE